MRYENKLDLLFRAVPSSNEIIVLLVEKDENLRRFYATTLQKVGGFTVRQTADGVSALKAIDVDTPDVVVLDLDLPAIRGLSLQQEIAARTHATSHSSSWQARTGISPTCAVACVLRKPVTADKLVETVRGCIGNGTPRGG